MKCVNLSCLQIHLMLILGLNVWISIDVNGKHLLLLIKGKACLNLGIWLMWKTTLVLMIYIPGCFPGTLPIAADQVCSVNRNKVRNQCRESWKTGRVVGLEDQSWAAHAKKSYSYCCWALGPTVKMDQKWLKIISVLSAPEDDESGEDSDMSEDEDENEDGDEDSKTSCNQQEEDWIKIYLKMFLLSHPNYLVNIFYSSNNFQK